MKQILILLIALFQCQFVFGQTDFCLPGATWVYYNPGNQAVNYEVEDVITYVGDTVISPYQNVKILKTDHRYQFAPGGTQIIPLTLGTWDTYIVQRSDSVLQLVDGNWEFLFDFNVETGNTRLVYIGGGECMARDTMQIESIDSVQLFGMNLRRTNYQILIEDQLSDLQVMPWGTVEAGFSERIGFSFDSPLGGQIYCSQATPEYLPRALVCYTDDEILSNGGQPCSLVLSISPELQKQIPEIHLINQEQLQVQNAPNSTFRVYDILGKELLQTPISSDNQTVGIEHLPNGILIVSVETEQGRISKKVVKTSN